MTLDNILLITTFPYPLTLLCSEERLRCLSFTTKSIDGYHPGIRCCGWRHSSRLFPCQPSTIPRASVEAHFSSVEAHFSVHVEGF